MCRAVRCSKCKKTTWAGCGAHVAQVMANVRPEDRCRCREEAQARPASAEPKKGGGFFGLFRSKS